MSAYKLYGDGIHDDFPAIQEMLDSGSCEVILPAPAKNYLITQTLVLSSNTRLVLPRFATIRLADGANCPMVMTRVVSDPDEGRIPHAFNDLCKHLWSHVTDSSPTAIT